MMQKRKKRWDESSVDDLTGVRVVITGGNSGIGLSAAKHLARAGADVVIACRTPQKAEDALEEIRREVPSALVQAQALDLADLASIRRFVEDYKASGAPLDILINNAGVMAPPLSHTADGFEMQMGTNHLGHFALTLPLLPLLDASPQGRVVIVASHAHVPARMDFNNLNAEHSYIAMREYGQSKLANLLFAEALKTRLAARGSKIRVTSAHPGYSDTALQYRAKERKELVVGTAMAWASRLFGQPSDMGAWPTVRAAADATLQPGDYVGPSGLAGVRGFPVVTWRMPWARDAEVAERLWEVSENLTNVRWSNNA